MLLPATGKTDCDLLISDCHINHIKRWSKGVAFQLSGQTT